MSKALRSGKRTPKRGSIQEQFVELRGVSGSLLHLETGGLSAYVSVMKLEGMSYDLKGEAEQRQLLELYQRLLRAISFPVQVLWHVLPLDLEAYLSPLLPGEQTRTA